MTIAFAAQLSAGANLGAYQTGFFAFVTILICMLSLKYGEKNISRTDCLFLALALLAIPVWLITNTALYAVLIVLIIDILGYLPTIRKSITKPHEENALAYFIAAISFGMAALAIEHYSLTTAIYPIVIMLMNIGFTAFLITQRQRIERRAHPLS